MKLIAIFVSVFVISTAAGDGDQNEDDRYVKSVEVLKSSRIKGNPRNNDDVFTEYQKWRTQQSPTPSPVDKKEQTIRNSMLNLGYHLDGNLTFFTHLRSRMKRVLQKIHRLIHRLKPEISPRLKGQIRKTIIGLIHSSPLLRHIYKTTLKALRRYLVFVLRLSPPLRPLKPPFPA